LRINKYLAHHTQYSRREADTLIKERKVKINHKIVDDMSMQVTSEDRVYIGAKSIKPRTNYTVIVYNKQRGELCTKKDPQGRKTIFHTLAHKFNHFITIGRLDFASEGLLLLTDAPRIADKLMTSDIERVYNIKIDGIVSEDMLTGMKEGIIAENFVGAHSHSNIASMEIAPFEFYEVLKNTAKFSRLKVCIKEGKNRELRRFFAHFGKNVLDLKRVQFGKFMLNNLPSGKTRYLSNLDYDYLRTLLDDKYKKKKFKKKDNQEEIYDEYTVLGSNEEDLGQDIS
jgi:23S rRNA pseudouridine2605 synthase